VNFRWIIFNKLGLLSLNSAFMLRRRMSAGEANSGPQKDRFRLQFQRALREHLARAHAGPEAFRVIWERTLEQVSLDETEQADLYWELIQWSASYDSFTSVPP
jgi:hypothetical protein